MKSYNTNAIPANSPGAHSYNLATARAATIEFVDAWVYDYLTHVGAIAERNALADGQITRNLGKICMRQFGGNLASIMKTAVRTI